MTPAIKASVFDDRPCDLGEGPLWHPTLGQLFWFDIIGKRLLTGSGSDRKAWQFDEHVSAAGWVDDNTLLVASETQLFKFDLSTGAQTQVVSLEAEDPSTRSNDGRADPWGGFWIGTMGKAAEPGKGAIYRFYNGELRQLTAPITISNAICFAPDRRFAYFTDTPTNMVMRQELDPETGWPAHKAKPWLDLDPLGLVPDGAVTDAAGNVWIAHWGAGKVSCYGPDAEPIQSVKVPGKHATCPAFGGPNFSRLFCTSAREGIAQPILDEKPQNGMTFVAEDVGPGRAEPQVIL
ncbi:MAG: SMP-30/gluconolactonase/LRE family protein [Pseudomonadota bacterium]